MRSFLSPPQSAPRGVRILHSLQTGIAALTLLVTLISFIIPSKHKAFTFGLLYTPILTSITTVFILTRERKAANEGALTKRKYVKYQSCKMAGAFGMSIIGFIGYLASSPSADEADRLPHDGDRGLWLNGVKIDRWQGMILWLGFFNWVFLWASLFYSCCMTGNRHGPIALTGEEAQIGLDPETADDEAIARDLQAQDENWQA